MTASGAVRGASPAGSVLAHGRAEGHTYDMKSPPSSAGLSRRHFLVSALAAAAAPSVLPSHVFGAEGATAPSNRIVMGCVGFGGEGMKNLNAFLRQPDAQVVAVCDVDRERRQKARETVNAYYKTDGCGEYADFRELFARPDIDAVQISTPDHWHVVMSAMALRAGKDVCCEKPTLTIAEGRILSDLVRRSGRVFQTSMEDRSLGVYHRMAELVRNGRIGKLHTIRVGLPTGGGRDIGLERQRPEPVPEGFDYAMWLGPAPEAPYCAARCHWNFRWIYDYSGGILTDWGAHLFDTAQWANDTERTGPVAVEGQGKFPVEGIYDAAYEFHFEYTYASGVKMLVDTGAVRLRFEGSDGWVGNNGWIGSLEASAPALLRDPIGPGEIKLDTCFAGEHRNFLDCVHSRREPYFPAEISHRVSTVAHLGNAAMLLGRKLRWDPAAEQFLGDDTANRMRSRALRAPWTV